MWRSLRIALLLIALATVALGSWRAQSRATAWEHTLHVTLYPINADGHPATARHIDSLSSADFAALSEWFEAQAQAYGVTVLQPLRVQLAPRLDAHPPAPPRGPGMLDAIVWSLHMRYWAWQHDDAPGPRPDIRLFVQYHDPANSPGVQHSVGLEKGLIGLANVFATRHEHGSNLVVIAHEMLHTVGATDKYDPATLQPRFPDGYAEPARSPRYPQVHAEIMGGRIPRSATTSDIPAHLRHTRVGALTAREIGWTGSD